MKSGTASEKAYDEAYKQQQTKPNSESTRRMEKDAKDEGGAEGRATQRGINHAKGRN